MKKLTIIMFCVLHFAFAQDNVKISTDKLYEKAYFMETAQRDLRGAEKVYEAIIALKPQPHLLAKCHLRLAEIYYQQNRLVSAKQKYDLIIKDFASQKDIVQTTQQKLQKYYGSKNSMSAKTVLQTQRLTIELQQAPLERFVHEVAEQTGLNIVLASDRLNIVSIKFKDVVCEDLLDSICRLIDTPYFIWNDIVIIGDLKLDWPVYKKANNVPIAVHKQEKYLQSHFLSTEFSYASSDKVFAFLGKVLGINLIVGQNAQGQSISMKLKNVSAKNILRIACALIDCRYHYRDSVIVVDNSHYITPQQKPKLFQLHLSYDSLPRENKFFTITTSKKLSDKKMTKEYKVRYNKTNVYEIAAEWEEPFSILIDFPGYYVQQGTVGKKAQVKFALKGKPRQLSFHIYDRATNKMVRAKRVKANGKQTNFRDRFAAGETVDLEVTFDNYPTYTKKITIGAGKGPFVISIPLTKK